jgi:hypothetical protein
MIISCVRKIPATAWQIEHQILSGWKDQCPDDLRFQPGDFQNSRRQQEKLRPGRIPENPEISTKRGLRHGADGKTQATNRHRSSIAGTVKPNLNDSQPAIFLV